MTGTYTVPDGLEIAPLRLAPDDLDILAIATLALMPAFVAPMLDANFTPLVLLSIPVLLAPTPVAILKPLVAFFTPVLLAPMLDATVPT